MTSTLEVMQLVEHCEWYDPIVAVVAEVMGVLEKSDEEGGKDTVFAGERVQDIAQLMRRVVRYAKCSDNVYVAAAIYLDRACMSGGVAVNRSTIYRLLAGCLLLAIKWIDDDIYENTHYSNVFGLSLASINAIERVLLGLLDWSLAIPSHTLESYRQELLQHPQYEPAVASWEARRGGQPRLLRTTRSRTPSMASQV
eukprot:TRINITY_DN435_c2_g1_i1.p1 TRINITY_DN435_c2_g1~~TRINITY_DN435_c2_g1_i1.p1  ORF type:complete len:209 (+),score=33.67 TRINITY_DN435_c2_g1_i1:39-629(+)